MQAPAAVHDCGPRTGLYQNLRTLAVASPSVAVGCSALLANNEQKDRILRLAFETMAGRNPAEALPLLKLALNRPWLGGTNFFNAVSVAMALTGDSPDAARRLLLASAKRHPELAVREYESYRALPFASEILAESALRAPDQAVSAASRTPALLEALQSSNRSEVRSIASIEADQSMDPQTKARVAIFCRQIATGRMSLSRAAALTRSDSGYFRALVDARLVADAESAPVYERAMTVHAQTMFRDLREHVPTDRMSLRDIYFLLTLGRAEEDDALFGSLFDRLLLPGLKDSGKPFSRLLAETNGLRLRAFLAATVAHHRLPALLAVTGEGNLTSFWTLAMSGIEAADDPMEEAVAASEIIENVPGSALASLAEPLAANAMDSAIYGLLATAVEIRMREFGKTGSPELESIVTRYERFFPRIVSLDTDKLFNASGVCVQRMFFYHDDDGVDSYLAFRQAYAHDPRWRAEEHNGWVKITGRSEAGRVVAVYANIPVDKVGDGEEISRQAAVTRLLADAGLEPAVVIHRGHSFHLQKTLPYLHSSTQLVYLGSCRGLQSIAAVIQAAPDAQVIATRDVGTMSINDPLLKGLNDELLNGKPLVWRTFWEAQERRLKGNPLFAGYLSPEKNGAALLISAYFNYLME